MPVTLPPFSHTGSSRDQGSIRTLVDRVDRLGREEACKVARGGTGSDDAFPNHLFLHPVGCWHRDDLADRSCGCARAIAAPVEQLRLTPAAPRSGPSGVRFRSDCVAKLENTASTKFSRK